MEHIYWPIGSGHIRKSDFDVQKAMTSSQCLEWRYLGNGKCIHIP